MATDTKTRITRRISAAHEHMQHQGPLRRAVSQTGLATANAVDRLTGWGNGDRTVFGSASAYGVMRGAVYGGIAAIVAAAIVPSLFAFGGWLVAGAAATGAVYYGIRDGQTQLEKHIGSDPPWRLSNFIARTSGAVGKQAEVSPEKLGLSGEKNAAGAHKATHSGNAAEPEKKPDFAQRLFAQRLKELERQANRRHK